MSQEDKWKKEAAWGQGGTQDSSLTSVGGQCLFRALTSRCGTRPGEKTQGESGSLCRGSAPWWWALSMASTLPACFSSAKLE